MTCVYVYEHTPTPEIEQYWVHTVLTHHAIKISILSTLYHVFSKVNALEHCYNPKCCHKVLAQTYAVWWECLAGLMFGKLLN